MIGLVQVGSQAMADRFTYLPLIGLLVACTWIAGDVLSWVRAPKVVAGGLALATVAACAVAARAQVASWKDSETLWQRAIDVVPDNDLAHANLGVVLAASGRSDEALAHLLQALRIVETPNGYRGSPPPEYAAQLHEQIGLVRGRQGNWREAIDHFRKVVRLRPGSPDAHHGLAQALAADSQLPEALRESRESIRLDPGRPEFHGDFASILYRAGDVTAALAELKEALRLGPTHSSAAKWHYNAAAMLNEQGQVEEAIRELEAALAINPGYEEARRALTDLRRVPL
jgi:tetratricopeptide (TPR) repeat protein